MDLLIKCASESRTLILIVLALLFSQCLHPLVFKLFFRQLAFLGVVPLASIAQQPLEKYSSTAARATKNPGNCERGRDWII